MLLGVTKRMFLFLPWLAAACFFPGCGPFSEMAGSPQESAEEKVYDSNLSDPRAKARFFYAQSRLLRNEGAFDGALKALQTAIDYDPDSTELRLDFAELLIQADQTEKAIQTVEDALALAPDSARGHRLVGNLYFRDDRFEDAVPHFRRVIELNPESENAYVHLSVAYARLGEFDRSIAVLKELLEKIPDSVAGRLTLARLYRQSHRDDLAEKEYRQILDNRPDLRLAYLELADLFQSLGQPEQALDTVDSAIEEFPDDPGLQHRRVRHLINVDRLDDALDQLRMIVEQFPEDLEARRKVGLIYMEQQEWDAAADTFQSLLEQDPGQVQVLYYYGSTLEQQKKWQEALEVFRRIPPDSALLDDAIIHRGYLLQELGRRDEAIVLVESHLQKHPDKVQLYLFLASLHLAAENVPAATEALDEGLGRHPDNIELLYEKGILLERMKDRESAASVMRRVLKLDPDHPEALNYLAYSYAEQGIRLDEALEMVQRALERKSAGHIIDTFGWIYYQQGRFEEALEQLEKASRLLPEDPVILEHLGDVYRAMGMTDRAVEAYRSSLEIDSENSAVREKLNVLQGNP